MIRKSQFHLPNATTGEQELHHFETEVTQVVGLKEHFRQPLTAYAVGDIVYSTKLPSYLRLECVAAGTTGSAEPDYASMSTGGGQ